MNVIWGDTNAKPSCELERFYTRPLNQTPCVRSHWHFTHPMILYHGSSHIGISLLIFPRYSPNNRPSFAHIFADNRLSDPRDIRFYRGTTTHVSLKALQYSPLANVNGECRLEDVLTFHTIFSSRPPPCQRSSDSCHPQIRLCHSHSWSHDFGKLKGIERRQTSSFRW